MAFNPDAAMNAAVGTGAIKPAAPTKISRQEPAPAPVVTARTGSDTDVVAFNLNFSEVPPQPRVLYIGGKPFDPESAENQALAARMTSDAAKAEKNGSYAILSYMGFRDPNATVPA